MRRCVFLMLLLVAACAGRTSRSPYEPRDTAHAEILSYDQDIRAWRSDLKLSLTPDERKVITMHQEPVQKPPALPAAGVGEICLDVCDLATRICEAQEHICKIAGELGAEDEWAAEKCDSAKVSCKEAKGRCESCLQGK